MMAGRTLRSRGIKLEEREVEMEELGVPEEELGPDALDPIEQSRDRC